MSSKSAPLIDQALQRLRKDVVTGNYPAGAKLKIHELQLTYGYSSTPLREALSRLAQEGLVRANDRRGFHVAPISENDIHDIVRMRLLLDPPALRESVRNGDEAWEARIVATFYRLEKIESRRGDGPATLDEEWSALHRDFHFALISACSSERQLAWSASLFDQAERYRYLSAKYRTIPRNRNEEHRHLMEATLQRDEELACALLTKHILSTEKNVRVILGADG